MSVRRGAGTAVALVIGGLAVAGLLLPSVLAPRIHEVSVSFPTADGLLGGGDVLEAGAKVGFIKDIRPRADNTALVTLEIGDDHWPLHRGVQAAVRPKSLLGEKYVALTDGDGPVAYDATQTLHATVAQVPVELDQFINSLDPPTRTAAQTLLDDLGAGVAGQGENLNLAIATGEKNLRNLAVTGHTLDNRDPQLDAILVGLDGVLQKITTTDQLDQLSQLITNGQGTLDAVEAERSAFSRSFADASVTLTELNTAFDSAVPNLRATLDVAPQLATNLRGEMTLLDQVVTQFNDPNLLASLEQGLVGGPTVTGGALEVHPDGTSLPIFRICFIVPSPGACTGNGGFSGQGTTALPAAGTGGSQMAAMAEWLDG